MRMRIRQLLALVGLTALETIRQPITLILFSSCLVFIGLIPMLITHTLGEGEKLVRDSALAVHFVCGLVLGSYAACATLSHEIRRGTAAAVLSKPVSRELFFVAKFIGIAAVMLCFSFGITLGTLLTARTVHQTFLLDLWATAALLGSVVIAYAGAGCVNFFVRRPFASNAFVMMIVALGMSFILVNFVDEHGQRAAFGSLMSWKLVPASALVAMAIVVLAAIAVSLASRLDAVATLSICSVILLIGLMSDYLFGRHVGESWFASVLYAAVPNWQHFWAIDALSGNADIPMAYLVDAASYGLLYLAAVLCFGMVAFRHMEVSA